MNNRFKLLLVLNLFFTIFPMNLVEYENKLLRGSKYGLIKIVRHALLNKVNIDCANDAGQTALRQILYTPKIFSNL